jgi:hypothetical protein
MVDNNNLKSIYPMTKKVNISDLYFSKEIRDPYRWLEDDLDKETKRWIEDQNLFTDKYFESLGFKEQIKDFIKTLSTRKLHKQLITGDAELAVVFFNAVIKLDIDILYLINKNFGDIPALMTKEALNIIFNHERTHQNKEERKIRNRLRKLSIRMDRLEAMRDI